MAIFQYVNILKQGDKVFSSSVQSTGMLHVGYLVLLRDYPAKKSSNLARFGLTSDWMGSLKIWADHIRVESAQVSRVREQSVDRLAGRHTGGPVMGITNSRLATG